MALQRQIHINRDGDRVTFDPPLLEADVGDQIFWTNNDDSPHWPGLPDDPTFFMPHQIAPGSTSSIFSPGGAARIDYTCTLADSDAETGTINAT